MQNVTNKIELTAKLNGIYAPRVLIYIFASDQHNSVAPLTWQQVQHPRASAFRIRALIRAP